MSRIRIYPYKQGSRSARVLADALRGRVLYREGSSFKPRMNDIIINWGSSTQPERLGCRYYNSHVAVRAAGNKRDAFVALQSAGVPIPAFALRKEDVTWSGLTVCRHTLTGHSGEGIELAPSTNLPNAPLYVEYIPKQDEFRVHVVGESIIAVQRKARDRNNPNPDWKVRNHANGFIFIREGFETPQAVLDSAVSAIGALGLDFGAVDVIWNNKRGRAYVLEVNTAPGLEGRTIDDYAKAFSELSA